MTHMSAQISTSLSLTTCTADLRPTKLKDNVPFVQILKLGRCLQLKLSPFVSNQFLAYTSAQININLGLISISGTEPHPLPRAPWRTQHLNRRVWTVSNKKEIPR